MTPTEQKALVKAKELINFFATTKITTNDMGWALPKELSKHFANKVCDENINTLNSMKGMGKIHKVKFWKLVKQNIEEM